MTEITTAEELDALPVGSVVRDRDRDEWTKRATPAVWVTPETRPFGSEYVARKWAPLTLVSRPDAPAPPAEDRKALAFEHTPEAAAFGAAIEQAAHDSGVGWDEVHPTELACRLMAAGYSLATRQPAPSFTPAQRHAAEQDEALFRVATRAQFGTGEVIDIVLRALGVQVVSAEATCHCAVYRSILRDCGVDPDGLVPRG